MCQVPHIGHVHAKILAARFGQAKDIFAASTRLLEKIDGIGQIRARSIRNFRDFGKAAREIEFLQRNRIQPIYINDPAYPQRLLHCYDPPVMLFYKGNADLNAPKAIAIVGTRNNTEYGNTIAEKLIRELAQPGLVVVSGLAFGIDAIVHKAALRHEVPTVGVTGHGLDMIYPSENTRLAREMTASGGLLTEFWSKTKPDKQNFPSRNRIVAGITDATIVVESGASGGSMITAEIAGGYHREVFAFPGRTTDVKSAGCNALIADNRAILLRDAAQLSDMLGWTIAEKQKPPAQKELFPQLSAEEQQIFLLLEQRQQARLDEIYLSCALPPGRAAAALLTLEMNHLVQSLPGNCYKLASG